MKNFLQKILDYKKQEIVQRKKQGLYFCPFAQRRPISLRQTLKKEGFHIIAEIKKASPSKGLLAPNLNPLSLAQEYVRGGASALSVLTEKKFFQGNIEYLAAIREIVNIPLLRKDFILDPIQIEEAKAFGADAILLIVAILEDSLLKELILKAQSLGLEALVEVHNEKELEKALEAGAPIIGINNRNLRTFEVDLQVSLRLCPLVPENIPIVAESGIKNIQDLKVLKKAGIKAALIGETLVKSSQPRKLLQGWNDSLAI